MFYCTFFLRGVYTYLRLTLGCFLGSSECAVIPPTIARLIATAAAMAEGLSCLFSVDEID